MDTPSTGTLNTVTVSRSAKEFGILVSSLTPDQIHSIKEDLWMQLAKLQEQIMGELRCQQVLYILIFFVLFRFHPS